MAKELETSIIFSFNRLNTTESPTIIRIQIPPSGLSHHVLNTRKPIPPHAQAKRDHRSYKEVTDPRPIQNHIPNKPPFSTSLPLKTPCQEAL